MAILARYHTSNQDQLEARRVMKMVERYWNNGQVDIFDGGIPTQTSMSEVNPREVLDWYNEDESRLEGTGLELRKFAIVHETPLTELIEEYTAGGRGVLT